MLLKFYNNYYYVKSNFLVIFKIHMLHFVFSSCKTSNNYRE